ncbi:hypothetical protein [Corynebacterium halotolerans]|uniref:hypothetical protein n=1 Tax=Corynebacterium halotolerans TaxID=225326 RepID=UPI0011EA7144|nr:hypothetical protein [Corynebacterium halotolerans]
MQEAAAERFNDRSAWVDFVNLAATAPHLRFRNQLLLADQVRERGANARAFASPAVWASFGYSPVESATPFMLRRSPTALSEAAQQFQSVRKHGEWVGVYERWQVVPERENWGPGVPSALTASQIAKTSPEGLYGQLMGLADQRGLQTIETEPKYLPRRAASLVHSRADNANVVLLRKDATEPQRVRGLIGVLAADMVSRLPGNSPQKGLGDINPFVASGIRHIVAAAHGLTDKRYQGVPTVPWPEHVDTNSLHR